MVACPSWLIGASSLCSLRSVKSDCYVVRYDRVFQPLIEVPAVRGEKERGLFLLLDTSPVLKDGPALEKD